MGQSFAILLPRIQETFLITPVQVGALITVREIVAGVVSLPGGILSDYLNRYRAHILTICLILFGAGWLIVAAAPVYGLLFVGMIIIASAGSVWQLPALVELGSRYAEKRGTVFAIHGAGGSIGDIIGPIATGLLLAYLSWREILTIYGSLPIILAVWTYLLFTKLNKVDQNQLEKPKSVAGYLLTEQLKDLRAILKCTHIWRVNIVAGLRGMCFVVLITFL
ncbi:MAG: MFS transporter, partial [Desulfobacterales bacterium]|nr:MFS transporter [Desulfobacterales bacterium]